MASYRMCSSYTLPYVHVLDVSSSENDKCIKFFSWSRKCTVMGENIQDTWVQYLMIPKVFVTFYSWYLWTLSYILDHHMGTCT